MAWSWTAGSWRTYSEEGKFWRSSEFNRIETAVGQYSAVAPTLVRLTALKRILDAVSAWRVWKQDKKGKSAGFVSPRTARDKGDKIAAKEEQLRDQGVLGDAQALSVRSKATDKLVMDVVVEVNAVLNLERTAWGGHAFTDPSKHDPSDFRYLVSAQSESKQLVPHREMTISDPKLIREAVISATVITSDRVNVWGPSGFILSAPESCVGAAFAGDLGANNAVAEGHALEKYREILRIYLRDRSDVNNPGAVVGLPAPAAVKRPIGHNEVVVLGRSYGELTSVAGIFILVEKLSDQVRSIKPADACRVITKLTQPGKVIDVVERLPGVTDHRMKQYRELNTNLGLPIVQIQAGAHTEVNGLYFRNLYDADMGIRFPFKASDMVEHGSPEHKAADKKATGRTLVESNHTCSICPAGQKARA
jgi:hypothetical protein